MNNILCNEEEWVYILSGRGIAEIGDREYEVEPGDFMGFGLPQQPHHIRNPFNVLWGKGSSLVTFS